ncbi:MAG: hypothetical protein JNL42_14450 [Anaerolineae bacterium]|nr:hypothetical protein [Anaerolineae bacterium]
MTDRARGIFGGIAAGFVLLALFAVVASADQRRGDSLRPGEIVVVQERSAGELPSAAEGATLVIERFEVFQRDGVFAGLNVTLRNVSAVPQRGSVWYLLSPPYDTGEAWRSADYTAPSRPVSLAPDERRVVAFDAPGLSVIGLFRVSIWAHVIDAAGASVHADAAGYGTPLVVEPEGGFGANLLEQWEAGRDRAFVPPLPLEGDVQIVLFELERSPRFLRGVSVSAANNHPTEVREIYLSYGIDSADQMEPWTQPVFSSAETRLALEPNQTLPVTFSVPETLVPGEYRLALWLRRSPVDPPTVAAEYTFQIDPLFTFALADETGQPPLVLTLSPSPPAEDGAFTATFALRNDSAIDRLVGVFYSVVPSDSLTPWRTAFASMPLRFINLKQRENFIFSDTRILRVPPGDYTIIGWVIELVEGRPILRAAYSRELRYSAR